MKRRDVVLALLALGTAPRAAEAQLAGKVYRIGVLDARSTVFNAGNIDAFRQGLRELGYKEGQNLEIVYRSSDVMCGLAVPMAPPADPSARRGQDRPFSCGRVGQRPMNAYLSYSAEGVGR